MTLKQTRQQLFDAIEATGTNTFYGMGAFTAPCARIFPAEPWVDISGYANGRRTQRWEVWAVAGKADSIATFDELEELVKVINDAVSGLPNGWAHPTWRRPAITLMGGVQYFACRGIVETTQEV
jgi:hypothetical protein